MVGLCNGSRAVVVGHGSEVGPATSQARLRCPGRPSAVESTSLGDLGVVNTASMRRLVSTALRGQP